MTHESKYEFNATVYHIKDGQRQKIHADIQKFYNYEGDWYLSSLKIRI